MVSLGCAKNKVDAEVMLGLLAAAGHGITNEMQEADVIIVNTCGFIESAKEEAIDAIFEAANGKREDAKLVVTGCLAQRHPQELLKEIPEVDAILGIGEIASIVENVEKIAVGERYAKTEHAFAFCGDVPRMLTTPGHYAYLKVADGCDNRCAYCAIPGIRGGYLSRPVEELEREARTLAQGGAKEIILVAQDTTRYGTDLYGRARLADLFHTLDGIAEVQWLRALYFYPEMIDEALLDAMEASPKICRYIDVPIQHISDEVLRRMNRRGGRSAIERAYRLARDRGFTLRTTVLVGFPGETQAQFDELASFLRDHPFDRLGAFAFSREEGTPAYSMPDQVPQKVAKAREGFIMRQQREISRAQLQKRVGDVERVLVEERRGGLCVGRGMREAPDIDGTIAFEGGSAVGDMADVRIVASSDYDLEGVAL
jgi:ribosomal protein S12 methylthiotransferase